MNNPYDNYRQQSVMTMTRGEMLVKLYDEILHQMNLAVRSIEEKNLAETNMSLQKCQTILTYLDNTLDKKYEVSSSLSSLYDFFIHQLVEANVHKDTAIIKEISPMISELRDSFVQAEKLSRMSQRQTQSPGMAISAVG